MSPDYSFSYSYSSSLSHFPFCLSFFRKKRLLRDSNKHDKIKYNNRKQRLLNGSWAPQSNRRKKVTIASKSVRDLLVLIVRIPVKSLS